MYRFQYFTVALAVLGLAPAAHAHHRDFTFLRDWFLPFKGEKEVESRTLYDTGSKQWVQEFEFEYGVYDNFAIEPGLEFHQGDGEKFHLDGYDLELRFRIGDFATNRILPAINIKYDHPVADEKPNGEVRFIASYMSSGGIDATANLVLGESLGDDPEPTREFDLGVVGPIGQNSREEMGYNIGIRGGFEYIRNLDTGDTLLGPTLIYRHDKHFNVLGTAAFPVNNTETNKTQLRFIMEYEF